eukprot:TRINITY_DN40699_c0_g1_i1.p1 TRINITY_DN40699_c0_g1~~TRINITY_DN40699_c0_g1_i1.p1  ORF type:complete len:154 (+),score=35.02 TRINITY_DN40699_c0_g1_i1:365-826(+)
MSLTLDVRLGFSRLNRQCCRLEFLILVAWTRFKSSLWSRSDLTPSIVPEHSVSWWQRRKFLKFASLDTECSGTIDGVKSDLDHKLDLNLVHATKIRNSSLQHCLFNLEKPSLTSRVKDMYRKAQRSIFFFINPSEKQQEDQGQDEEHSRRKFG